MSHNGYHAKLKPLIVATAVVFMIALAAPPAAAAPTPKDLIFFLHYVADPGNASKTLPGAGSTWTYFDTTTEWNATNATFYANGSLQDFEWYLTPPLAGPVNVTDFSLAIWAQSISAGATNAQTRVELFERNATGVETSVHDANFGSQSFPNTPTLKQFNATLAPAHRFAAGSSIKVVLTLNPGTGSLQIMFDTARADSRLVLRTADSAAVASVEVADSAGTPVSSLDPQASNKTARFTATVSDPYGGYDIEEASISIFAPNGTTIVDNATMSRTSGTPLSLETTFEKSWDYSGRAPGEYTAVVYVMDNSGESWFTHFAQFSYGPYGDSLARPFFIGSLPLFAVAKFVDDHNVSVAGASVTLSASGSTVATGTTDALGLLNLTAFAGNYTLTARWEGVQVASVPLNLTANISAASPFEVRASIYYPTLKVVDSRGAAVEHAFAYLVFPNGTATVVPLRTADDGAAAVGRMAGGSLEVRVLWRGVEVASTSVAVDSSGEFRVAASVFYLTVQVNDGSGAPLSLALVRMDEAAFGLLSVANVTGPSGTFTERLPSGSYDLSVNWRGVAVGALGGQALNADTSVMVSARVFVLTVKTVAADGSALPGATVTVKTATGGLFEVAVADANGTASFQAPEGSYSVSGHVVGTYYWTQAEETVVQDNVTLDQARTVALKFTKVPGGFVGSNMFVALLLIVLLIAVLLLLQRRHGAQVKELRETHGGLGASAEAKPGEINQREKKE